MNRITFFSITLLALTACRSSEETKPEVPVVRVIRPQVYSEDSLRSFAFISEPYRTSELSFRVGGPIQQFQAEEGQFFRSGSLIATLDPRDYLIALQKAKAEKSQKEAEYQRIETLYHKNNVSASSYEQARADMEKAEAAYQEALHNLRDTRMTAPADGYVQQVFAECYDKVTPSQTILTFIDLSRIKITVNIPEQMALAFNRQTPPRCRIIFSSQPTDTLESEQAFVTRNAQTGSISYICTVLLRNDSRRYMGGMSGTLLIQLPASTTGTLSVPLNVICHDPVKGSYVWTVDTAQHAQKTWIKTGSLDTGNRIEVLQGLRSDQQIITGNFNNLSINHPVNIK